MIREDVVLYADGGDMTVGRRTGVFTWGNFDVILPEGREQEESDQRLQDGFISRPLNRPTGRFDIGFVRADARIDLEAQTSDLEMVIDTAQKRAEGDMFFERDITGHGLGRYRPGVDFDTGDIVQVEVWGKRIFQPVTAVEMLVSDSEGPSGARVHVGGQLVADAVTLRRHNDALSQQLAADKRQLRKEAGEIRETAEVAKTTAEGVQEDLHSTHVEPVEEGWAPEEEGWDGTVETLNKNFVDFVEFQQDTNQRMQERVDEHERLIKQLQEAKTRALASTTRIIAGGPGTTLDHDGEFIRLTINGRDLTVEALGDWSGDIILNAVRARTDTGEYATGEIPSPYQLQWRIPHPDYSRERIFTIPTTGPYTEWISATVIAQIRPGTMVEELVPLTKLLPDRDTWDTVATFTTLTTGEHTIIAVVEWDKTTWQDTYGMHLLANGTLLATTGVRTRVGPLVSIGDGGRRRWVLDVQDIHLDEETEITLQVWAGAPGETQRRIHDGELRVWWIDTGEENNTIEEIP